MSNQLFLESDIDRNLDELDSFREHLLSYLIDNGMNPETASHFELCAYEVIANIIEHTPPFSGSTPLIHVTFSVDKETGILTINYHGPEFDLTKRPLPDIPSHFDKGLKRGLGIYIIHKLMEEIWYKHKDGNNRLTMKKSISES
ncbi:MAG: ATP-binding protein [Spirochaetes bacterium]|nr:ATP-binding protein [Spirochaetota bacterium]